MRAILLAAGRGRRLEASGWLEPKCLLPFEGTTILDNMLDGLAAHGIREVTLVVGYKQESVRACAERHGLDVRYVENPDYESTNTINSLWRARADMAGDFLYFNADVLFHHGVLGRLLAVPGSRLAIDRKSCGEEEVKVVVDESRRIRRIGKLLDPADCAGEFIGIGKFEAAMNAAFVASLERHNVELGNTNLFFEAALDDVLEEAVVHEVDVSDLPTIEIDFPDDLREARAVVAPRLRMGRGGPGTPACEAREARESSEAGGALGGDASP